MRIAVWCETHDKIVDEGEVDIDSSLLLWNDFTKAKEHLHCIVILRMYANVLIHEELNK